MFCYYKTLQNFRRTWNLGQPSSIAPQLWLLKFGSRKAISYSLCGKLSCFASTVSSEHIYSFYPMSSLRPQLLLQDLLKVLSKLLSMGFADAGVLFAFYKQMSVPWVLPHHFACSLRELTTSWRRNSSTIHLGFTVLQSAGTYANHELRGSKALRLLPEGLLAPQTPMSSL